MKIFIKMHNKSHLLCIFNFTRFSIFKSELRNSTSKFTFLIHIRKVKFDPFDLLRISETNSKLIHVTRIGEYPGEALLIIFF